MDRMPTEFYDALPRSKYDGNNIWGTRDCVGYQFYRGVTNRTHVSQFPPSSSSVEDEKEGRCYWGVAWKKIFGRDKVERCRVLNSRRSPRLEAFEKLGEPVVEVDNSELIVFWKRFIPKGVPGLRVEDIG